MAINGSISTKLDIKSHLKIIVIFLFFKKIEEKKRKEKKRKEKKRKEKMGRPHFHEDKSTF